MSNIILAFLSILLSTHLSLSQLTSLPLEFNAQHELRRPADSEPSAAFPLSHLSPAATLRAQPTTVHRIRSQSVTDVIRRFRERSVEHGESEMLEWDPVEVLGPDVEDRHTLAQLAKYASIYCSASVLEND